VAPPHIVFAVLPLSLFLFKLVKMFSLYRLRLAASLRQSLAAGLAGLSLSHTIARAILAGFITRHIGFFRTPKCASSNRVLQALLDTREELLFLVALGLSAIMVLQRPDGEMLDIRVWSLVLLVQAIPYAAAGLVSFLSGLPGLPAALIGPMQELTDQRA
jgi:hypothetical protein